MVSGSSLPVWIHKNVSNYTSMARFQCCFSEAHKIGQLMAKTGAGFPTNTAESRWNRDIRLLTWGHVASTYRKAQQAKLVDIAASGQVLAVTRGPVQDRRVTNPLVRGILAANLSCSRSHSRGWSHDFSKTWSRSQDHYYHFHRWKPRPSRYACHINDHLLRDRPFFKGLRELSSFSKSGDS